MEELRLALTMVINDKGLYELTEGGRPSLVSLS
jgi:hypothetical protein